MNNNCISTRANFLILNPLTKIVGVSTTYVVCGEIFKHVADPLYDYTWVNLITPIRNKIDESLFL